MSAMGPPESQFHTPEIATATSGIPAAPYALTRDRAFFAPSAKYRRTDESPRSPGEVS